MYKSNQTQKLANYFDSKMVRTRENPISLDAQLLNTAAVALDDANIRYNRELKALQLPNCPTGLDNNGVYYKVNLDQNYSLSAGTTTLNSLVGITGNTTTALNIYNDLLPIPAGYKVDPLRTATRVDSPILTTFIGSPSQVIIKNDINLNLPIINKLTFWLSEISTPEIFIDVVITGIKYPQFPWTTGKIDTENLQISNEGFAESANAWVTVNSIVVRNLPISSVLTCYSIGFTLPGSLDSSRPVSHPSFRDTTFPRYWQVDNVTNTLKENYLLDNLTGLTYYQSYYLSSTITDVLVEPNTWGGLLADGTLIHYFDRREPLPSLSNTGLTVEPCFGLDVFYDIMISGPTRNVIIRPVPYAKASTVSKYRIVVQTPSQLIVLLKNGSYVPYSGGAGWFGGIPSVTNMLLPELGTYTFTLECLDSTGAVTTDIFPYQNFDVEDLIKGVYDLSSIIINIEGMSYDFLGNLWLYDGLWAIPIKPYYNGYILDVEGRAIYLTDKWDQVTYS